MAFTIPHAIGIFSDIIYWDPCKSQKSKYIPAPRASRGKEQALGAHCHFCPQTSFLWGFHWKAGREKNLRSSMIVIQKMGVKCFKNLVYLAVFT